MTKIRLPLRVRIVEPHCKDCRFQVFTRSASEWITCCSKHKQWPCHCKRKLKPIIVTHYEMPLRDIFYDFMGTQQELMP